MALLIGVSHENICRLLAFSNDGPAKCLVLELCTGGSLEGRLRQTGQPAPVALTWLQRARIAQEVLLTGRAVAATPLTRAAGGCMWPRYCRILTYCRTACFLVQVARALAHLHSLVPQMIHRDLKSANVLLDAAGVVKVADFGEECAPVEIPLDYWAGCAPVGSK